MLAFSQQVLSPESSGCPAERDLNLLKNGTLRSTSEHRHGLRRRQITSSSSACGYLDGDPDKPRTANHGFACRVDTVNALWGFCTTAATSVSDCNLAANCIDSFACLNGCGTPKSTGLATATCSEPGAGHCSTALLQAGPDQTWTYIACGQLAVTDHLFAAATTPLATLTLLSASITTQATPSNTSPSSTGTSSSTSSTSFKAYASATAASEPPESSANNVGAIVGGVIGGLGFILLAGFAIFFLRLYSKRHPKTTPEQNPRWIEGPRMIQQNVNNDRGELAGLQNIYPSS